MLALRQADRSFHVLLPPLSTAPSLPSDRSGRGRELVMRSNGISRRSKGRSTLTGVAISGDRLRGRLLDALALDEDGFDVIVVESIAHGYSRIKQLTPDVVVVLLEIDDVDACQLLAMLTLDRNVSRIPVVTCVASRGGGEFVKVAARKTGRAPSAAVAAQAN